MAYEYKAIYQKHAAWLRAKPRYKRAVLFFNRHIAKLFALAYLALLAYVCICRQPWELARAGLPPLCALALVTALRAVICKPRPYEQAGAGITPLLPKKSLGNSFPSRHLTCASVISVVFLPYFPVVGGVLLLLSLALGYTRFAVGWHYPLDVAVGFLLGALLGGAAFLL